MNNKLINITSRRSFIKAGLGAGALALAASFHNPNLSYAQAATTKALDINDPTAKDLGYVEDAAKADAAKRTNTNATCANCVLFAKGGLKADGKDGEYGQCTIFPQGLVAAKGWCISWAQKPGT